MKRLVSMMILVALFLTAWLVSADAQQAIRPPVGCQQRWLCHQEDQAKFDKNMKAIVDEAAKSLQSTSEREPQESPGSF